MQKPLSRLETIELVIPALAPGTKFNFLDIPQLRSDVTKDIIISQIEAWVNPGIVTDFNGNPLPSLAQLQLASLTLYVEGEESFFRIPVIKLVAQNNNAVTWFNSYDPVLFNNIRVDWTKSYITTPTAFGNAAQMAFIFSVGYQRLKPGTIDKINAASGANVPVT
jgi:hypothetical protein